MKGDKSLCVSDITEQQSLPAGEFSSWLQRTRNALQNENGADVPCGKCTACCRSSYFIHVGPDETEALSRIPGELLSAAPGLPAGNVVLGYDQNGCCPMLVDDKCSIYEYRPRTCRSFDCRVFAAAGIDVVEDDKAPLAARARRWKFDYPAGGDRKGHAAVKAAAKFLQERPERISGGTPGNSTQLAILAIRVYDVFLEHQGEHGKNARVRADADVANEIAQANRNFEAERNASKK